VEERWTPNPRPTVGIDYNVRKLDVAGQLLKLQICDFSGDERFLRITLSYLRLADGVLLVYDVTNRETLDHLVALMSRDDVRDHLPRSVRLMLIGNKADCDDAIREVSQDEGQNFANQLGIPYLETSAKTGWNVLRTVYLLCTNMMLQSSRSKGAPPGRGVTWSSRTIKTSLSPSPPPASRDGVGALANERTPSSEGYASAQEVFDSDEEEVGETVPLKSRTWSPLSRKKKEIDLSEWCNPLDIPRSPSPRRILRSPLTSPAH
jgi:Ras-related protein Rab-8A